MPISNKPKHIFEPNPLACGQAVLAMVSDTDIEDIFNLVGTKKETTLNDMKNALKALNISISRQRLQADKKSDLPQIALLSLETPHCWHWSLYFKGTFFDPEYGKLENFPPSKRRYFWELKDVENIG
ncbi:MAG: hypothetical protein MJ076_05755 [Clostridia bacterium]|nr:hypothetical protein [Clostridia bacterium]